MNTIGIHPLISQHLVWCVKSAVPMKITIALHIVKDGGIGVKLGSGDKCFGGIPEIDSGLARGLDFFSFLVYTGISPGQGVFI